MPASRFMSFRFTLPLILPALSLAAPLHPTTQPDTRMRPPAEELADIALPDGYHLELVAAEPDVISPTIVAWDGNGRMYVAEMRSYMLDLDGRKAHTPMSRVSRFESTRNDGVYDRHVVFADKLMLPRMVLPLDGRVLIRETDTKDIYCYTDTNNDGVADKKERIYEGGPQEGNLEHQPSGLIWDLDNWIYVTHQTERFRFTHDKMEKEPYDLNVGQWGLAMTDTGRLIFATAGNENPAHHFQVMPPYGSVDLPGEVPADFYEVFPLARMTDVQGGPPRLKPEGGLNRFTSCAGPCIYRGDALPHDLYGDYILPEPVGRLVRRAKVVDENGKMVIKNPPDMNKREFIASVDPNFRPVWSATGPDGCLYFCDMYHGIIQEANWTKEGSYLRPQIEKYGLQKNINGGRIWRLTHDGFTPRKSPHMLDESSSQLVRHLSDPNGWWRDTAQKLLVLRHDLSVVPALREMAAGDSSPLARLHAFWTLDGLDAATPDLVIAKLRDADPRLRTAAVRVAEPYVRRHVAGVARAVRDAAFDLDPEVAKQVLLSMRYLKDPSLDLVTDRALNRSPGRSPEATKTIAAVNHDLAQDAQTERENAERKKLLNLSDPQLAATFELGRGYYQQMCITCHAAGGTGAKAPGGKDAIAPRLKGSQRLQGQPELVAKIVLNGLTGPHDGGHVYPEQMPSFKWADDARLAAVLTYARNEWGNAAPAIRPEDIARARPVEGARNKPYRVAELPAPVVQSRPKEVFLTPALATLHGNGLLLTHSPATGEAIAFGINRDASASWRATLPAPGVYELKVRCNATGPTSFTVKVGDKTLAAAADAPGKGEIDLGACSLTGTPAVEFHPPSGDDGRPWSPLTVQSLILEQLE